MKKTRLDKSVRETFVYPMGDKPYQDERRKAITTSENIPVRTGGKKKTTKKKAR